MPMRRALLAAMAAAALAGCSTLSSIDWNPMNWFGRSPPPPPAPLAVINNPLTVKPLWQASIGKAGRGYFVPAVVGTPCSRPTPTATWSGSTPAAASRNGAWRPHGS